MQIRIKKLTKDAKLPRRGTASSAGYDLTASGVSYSQTDGGDFFVTCRSGLAFEIPPGHVGLLSPRSSVWDTGLSMTNCVGGA